MLVCCIHELDLARKSREAEFNDRRAAVEIKTLASELAHARKEQEKLEEQLSEQPPEVPQSFVSELARSRRNNDRLLSRVRALETTDVARENARLRALINRLEDRVSQLDSESLEQIQSDGKHTRLKEKSSPRRPTSQE